MTKFDYDFMKYISKFNKMYNTTEEFEMRKELFRETHEFIKEANAKGGLYRAGHNKFSDYTQDEMDAMLGLKNMPAVEHEETTINVAGTPTSWDWRDQGDDTKVKDQESCGSCWAFSATEVVESLWMIAGNPETIMAPQQLVDCDPTSDGCNGGWYFWAYDYLKDHALMKESDYPYHAVDQTC